MRKLQVSDAEKFFSLNSDPEVLKYTGDYPFLSIEDAKSFLKNYQEYNINGYGRWAVLLKETNDFIGWCSLKRNKDGDIDIGFRFFRNKWNKGYATESSIAALAYGFTQLGIKEIIARVVSENKASIKVLEKIGMTFWKKSDCKGIPNVLFYKIDKSDFQNIVCK
ncbi:GNAT family N-acetyltransferase [Aquimarina latercula]|uniref:GNAT family N-acetyltransferase n=1 Tax=Aquimarina latercula TaxID=987 RepID=UPI0004155D42|nr:GNAT family N-acetyltransferase [Aquimarina latercula]